MFQRSVICWIWLSLVTAHAALDLDHDGLGDVWQLKFPGAAITPGEDADGDGQNNQDEATSGTDPYTAEDVIRITQVQKNEAGTAITWPSRRGKRYAVECSPSMALGSWITLGSILEGTGEWISSSNPSPHGTCFFRVRVSDIDTDADGITDWEELQVGYNPLVNEVKSCGCGLPSEGAPNNTCGVADLARLTLALARPSVVTISASDASATEPSTSAPADSAVFVVRRSGGIGPLAVSLSQSGTAASEDYAALPSKVSLPMGVNESLVSLIPVADGLLESPETVVLTISPGIGYTPGAALAASSMINDQMNATGSGLLGAYWKHPSERVNTPDFTGVPSISRIDATVNFDNAIAPWPGAPITAGSVSNYFSSRWVGEILPEYSQFYTIFASTNDGGRLWVNGKLVINKWPAGATATGASEQSAVLFLEAGKRHPIVLEHYNNTGGHLAVLSWQSPSQPKQPIPQARLFPNSPPQIYGPYEAWTFLGAPEFSHQIHASGTPTSYESGPLPSGVTLDGSGLLSGNPTVAGVYDFTLTARNSSGSGSVIFRLNVLQTSGGITREVWPGVPGGSITSIPFATAPASTSLLTSLAAPSDVADDYGVRIRGFITAPIGGEYRFFLRGDQSAVFSLSNDDEPVNLWKRAELTAPSASASWSGAATSPLLHLEAGHRYYLEILHKAAQGTDHLALGWSKPGENDAAPSEIVPGHVLTRYEDAASAPPLEGTLFFAQLQPQSGALSNGSGTCTVRLSADKTTAWVRPQFTNLGSSFTGMHMHDARLPPSANIVFDLDEPNVKVLADGSYVWDIVGVGALSAAQIAEGLGQTSYFNVHSLVYPNGEIKGYLRKLDGSSTFTAPPAPPPWTSEAAASISEPTAAARFLQQATFGANVAEIASLQAQPSFSSWIDVQFTKPITYHLPYVRKFRNLSSANSPTYPGNLTFNSWWKNSIEADDQLRQRIAFALHEIFVISESGPLNDQADAISSFYDLLLDHSFGNVRDLLEAITLHPAMGRYLDMLRNDKPNLSTGLIPNENYAREILQLFSLGLNRTHPDGSLILNSKGLPIPVYDQDAVIGIAHAFTGWDYHYPGNFSNAFSAGSNWTEPMREVPFRHFIGKKRILNNVILPGIPSLNPYGSHSTAQVADPTYQALPANELEAIHDQIFQHPNLGPFLCQRLIQRLVTSQPSRPYIYRVTQAFNDDGTGIRGDMKAVIKAILLDTEARSTARAREPSYGKQIEPIIRITQLARAFRPANNFAGTFSQDGGLITIDTTNTTHRLSANQKVQLGFTSAGTPSTDGDYSVLSVSGNTFSVRTKDCLRSTWVAATPLHTITTPTAHNLVAGQSVYIIYRNPPSATEGLYQVATIPSNTTFTITTSTLTGNGTCDVAFARGLYTQRNISNVPTLTFSLSTRTGLVVGSKVTLHFTPTTGQTTVPTTGIYTIIAMDSSNPHIITITPDSGTLPASAGSLSGSIHLASADLMLTRQGTAISGYSDWNVGETDTVLGQTPLRSPTVFNYFLPDHLHPGALAAAGITTPEFQISSETNVIRQANFLFGGIYSSSSSTSSGYTNGFSSFREGGHDIMMDFSAWMAPRTSGADYWTNTINLRDLIREQSKLLMAGHMSTAMENYIYNFVTNTSNISYHATAPSEIERRNRVRAIIYLIAVSPEFSIQR